jgi:hypothetical protein
MSVVISLWNPRQLQQDGGTFGERAHCGSLQICFSGSLEKQSLTLFPVYYDNFSNLDSYIFTF